MAGFVGSGSTTTLGTGAGTGGTSLSVSKTGCAAGNLLIIEFSLWRSTNTDAGTMSASGWTTGPQQVESASSRVRTGWLFLPNCGSGTQSASLSWANSADCTARIHEYSGMGAATLDGTNGNSSSNSPFGTGNATSVSTGELAFDVIADDGANVTYTISDGKNNRGGQNPSASVPALLGGDLLSTSSTTNSGAWTSSPTNVPGNAVYAIGVLLPGPTGGATIGPIQPGQTWKRQFWLGLLHPFPGAPPTPAATLALVSDPATSSAASGASATAALAMALAATTPSFSGASGNLSLAEALASAAPAFSTGIGLLALAKALQATAGATSGTSATLVEAIALAAGSPAVSRDLAMLAEAIVLAGLAPSVTAATALLQTLSGTQIAGLGAAYSTGTGTLSLAEALTATSPASSGAAGALRLAEALASTAPAVSRAIAQLGLLIPLNGKGDAMTGASGLLAPIVGVGPVAPPVTVLLIQGGATVGLFGGRARAQPQEGRDDVEPQ